MCRLLGYVAVGPISVAGSLGVAAFDAFTSLAAVHGDGWGMAWRSPGDPATHVATSAMSAAQDSSYADMAAQRLGAAGLVHLRWATDGLAVTSANTHPFTDGGYALAHNGSIWPIDQLKALLSEDSSAKVVGSTDSEHYFRFVLQCIHDSKDEAGGVIRAVRLLHGHFPHSSLNALLLTPTHMFAVHVNSRAPSPVHDLRELFESDEAMPAGHATAYFDMAYRITANATHIISSGLTDHGWSKVPADTVLMVDLATRDMTLLDPWDSRRAK